MLANAQWVLSASCLPYRIDVFWPAGSLTSLLRGFLWLAFCVINYTVLLLGHVPAFWVVGGDGVGDGVSPPVCSLNS